MDVGDAGDFHADLVSTLSECFAGLGSSDQSDNPPRSVSTLIVQSAMLSQSMAGVTDKKNIVAAESCTVLP